MDHHGLVLLEVAGELTAVEAPDLLDAVGEALAASPRKLQLGLAGVTFIDSGGIQAIVRIRNMTQPAGVPLQLLGPSRPVRRVLDVSGLAGVFDIID
jgi:anti-sigma B factor antagonist